MNDPRKTVFAQLNNVLEVSVLEPHAICFAHIEWLLAHMARLCDDREDFQRGLELLAEGIETKAIKAWNYEESQRKKKP